MILGIKSILSFGRKYFYLLVVLWILIGLGIVGFFLFERFQWLEKMPSQVDIQIENPDLSLQVSRRLAVLLQKHRGHRVLRSVFLKEVNESVRSFDLVDEVWVRLGLDGILRVHVSLQVPEFLLNTKNGEYFVFSQKGAILNWDPDEEILSHLFELSIPDVKIISKKTSSIDKGQFQVKPFCDLMDILHKAQKIQEESQGIPERFVIEKKSWTFAQGFKLDLKYKLQNTGEESKVIVIVGDGQIESKMKRLKKILSYLDSRGQVISSIDLDYSDRALVK